MNDTEYQVKTIETKEELEEVYGFAVSVLGDMNHTGHSLDFYRKHFSLTSSLLICAKRAGNVIGCALGSIDEDHVLVGPTAVAAGERGQGIGSAMMQRLEAEAKNLGQTTLILGALREAESFYAHCGYRSNLFIQLPEAGQGEKLKQLNQEYPVIWESNEGKWTRLMLATPQVDRELQVAYEQQFPECHTQYVFIKEIG